MRWLAPVLAGLLLAGCDAEDKREVRALSERPTFPNRPPKIRPKPRTLAPRSLVYEHPVYRYPLPPDPNAPIRNPDVRARVIEEVAPEYTPIAARAKIAGIVILEVVIDAEGNVSDARVLKPLPMGLDQKAIEAVRQWRFEPARHHGKPAVVFQNVTVRFRPPAASQ